MAERPHRIRKRLEDIAGTQRDKSDVQFTTRPEQPAHLQTMTHAPHLPYSKEGHNQDDYGGLGNVYTRFRKPFGINQPGVQDDGDIGGPYLEHVRRLSRGWQHLRYLADFMAYSTTTKFARSITPEQRCERNGRTHVSVLTITLEDGVGREDLFTTDRLTQYLAMPTARQGVAGRLFVVEDLSTTVIEQLGAKFDIDPHFFRDHINDCIWYSPLDPTVQLPELRSSSRKRNYHNIQYLQGRFFENDECTANAKREALSFNVMRGIDTDSRRKKISAFRGIVGLVRSKVSVWTQPWKNDGSDWIGIIIIDPTIQEGDQLWTGYGNIAPPPSMHDQNEPVSSPYRSAFEDFIHWAQNREQAELLALRAEPSLIFSTFYTMVCTQWLLVSEYTHALLNRFEWDIEGGLDQYDGENFDRTLRALLTWRRRLPTYSGHIKSAIRQISQCYDVNTPGNTWTDIMEDFEDISRRFDSLRDRADRGLNVAVAVTAREDSKKATQESHAVTRVTYLAFVFVPLSFVASFMSMSGTFPVETYWIYFVTAIPLSAAILLLLVFASHLSRLWDHVVRWLTTVGVGKSAKAKSKKDVNKIV